MKEWMVGCAVGVVGLVVLVGLLTPQIYADKDDRGKRYEVVVLNATVIDRPAGPGDSFTGYNGMGIWASSSSGGAPAFSNYPEPMMPLAQALADLLSQGYHINHIGPEGRQFILIKK